MFEQFTEYLTGWQICQLPLSSEGSKLFSFRGASPPDLLTRGSAPGLPGDHWGLRPQTAAATPTTANPLASPLRSSEYHMLTFIATDLQLYKIFKISQFSFFGIHNL